MADLNSYNFTGRLGADATVATTPNGKSVMEMSVAINSGYGDYKKTIWVKVKQYGDRVNNIVGLFTKGSQIAGCGELGIDKWSDRNGMDQVNVVITCMNIQLLHKKEDGSDGAGAGPDEPIF